MEVESVLVTGANRGIGLEFVRQLVELPKPPRFVFATYRNPDTIQDLAEIRDSSKETRVVLIKADVTKTDDIGNARKIVEDTVGENGLNLLINNSGASVYEGFPEITQENLMLHFSVNTVGPVLVTKELFPLLKKAAALRSKGTCVSRAAVLNISSRLGSITENPDHMKKWHNVIGYQTSKAALNMAMRVIAMTVKDDGIFVVNICPGWVKTDMGSKSAALEPSESISAMIKTLSQLNESHHGSFLDKDGEIIAF